MARINLLQWREAERKRRRLEFAVAGAIAAGATLLVALLVHLLIEGRISDQQARNGYLEKEIGKIELQIKEIKKLEETKASLLARMNIIQQLQESRPEVVRLFDDLVSAVPEGVYLTQLEQSGRAVVVEGRAQSNARVSAFMRNIEQSRWIGNPHLLLIENKDKTGTGMSHFRLSFDQIQTTATPEDGVAARGPGIGAGAG